MSISEFCASALWDYNLTWNTRTPDFTPCFQSTVLVWIPCLSFLLLAPCESLWSLTNRHCLYSFSRIFLLKLSLLIWLQLLSILQVVCNIYLLSTVGNFKPISDVLGSVLESITYILILFVTLYTRKRRRSVSKALSFFWLLEASSLLIRFYSSFIHDQCRVRGNDINCLSQTILRMQFPAVLIQLVLSAYVESSAYQLLDEDCQDYCQLRSGSLFSSLFFTWMNKIIKAGEKKKLQIEDLPPLCIDISTRTVCKKFDSIFNKFVPFERIYEDTSNEVKFVTPNKCSLLRLLLNVSWWPFLLSTITEIMYIFFSLMPPFILKSILSYVQTSEEYWHGYVYAVGFYITVMMKSVSENVCYYFSGVAAICIKSALTSAIYKKLFRFDFSGTKQYTAGEVVNLISVDTWEIIGFVKSISSFWGIPLQIGVAFYFLWQILGVASLGSIAVIVFLSPISVAFGTFADKFQTRIMTKRDERLKEMSEVLNGIKVLKLYAWEKPFMKRIQNIRCLELQSSKTASYVFSFFVFIWSSVPDLIMLVCLGIYTAVNKNEEVNAEIIFVSLSLISLLHTPVAKFPGLVYSVVRANVSYGRIHKFLFSEDIDPTVIKHDTVSDTVVGFEDAVLYWVNKSEPTLQNINLKIQKGTLTAIIGSVGCGKSSLLSAIIGEMKKKSGEINTQGSIAYVAQQAWIQNATLKKNILYVRDLDLHFYKKVVRACALKDDLDILPGGDSVEIGENGINLSGGQKQRVSLARAVYQDCDMYLLDDPLSAVDANVASHLFQRVIGPSGLLSNKTRVLVTHNTTFLSEMDNIVVMEEGKIAEQGSYSELINKGGHFCKFLQQHEVIQKEQELEGKGRKLLLERNMSVISNEDESKRGNDETYRLTDDESTEFGRIKWKVYKNYIQKFGIFLFVLAIFIFLTSACMQTASGLWLSYWSTSSTRREKQNVFLGVYGGIVFSSAILTVVADTMFFVLCINASAVFHSEILSSVMRSPLSFFDTTPVGRILNRFSKDIESIDESLPYSLSSFISCFLSMILLLVVIAYASVYLVIVVLVAICMYLYVLKIYINSSNQLERMNSISQSPLFSNVSETLSGVSTIRAFGSQKYFIEKCNRLLDENLKCYYFSSAASRWLDCVLSLTSGLIILAVSLTAVLSRNTLSAGLVGLVLNYCVEITNTMSWTVSIAAGLENEAVSLERIHEFSNLPPEADWDIEETKPPSTWPENGTVEFENFSVKYREGLDPVLKDLTFRIEKSTKVGVVGRTGAGKSSLVLSLFRIMEPTSGKIIIDDKDASTLGLYVLRSRLTVIPQDPVVFAGSLRMNLDPWDESTDDDIWSSLEKAHLKSFVSGLAEGLMYEITEGGGNLSAGQKQLLCLARALLRHSKILILDEATASVDLDTDELIQQTIRQAFSDCTVITIAHRLKTIMDYDRIIVLSEGRIIEDGSPELLIQNNESQFYRLAKDANII